MALPDRRVRGGPPSHLYLLRDSLVRRGVDVRGFVYGGRTHDESSAAKLLGRLIDLIRFPFLLAKHRPDVVHLNTAFDRRGVSRDIFFVTLGRMLGQKLVLKFHGSDLDFLESARGMRRWMINRVIRGSNLVCVLSGEEQRAFEKRFPGSRFAMVKNALDFDRYHTVTDFRAAHGIPKDKPLLLFIARFIGTKGLKETIEALPAIRESHDVHAALVGDGPVRGECARIAERLGVADCVTFTGYVPEDRTVDAYLASDMLVFPSYHQEGMPMVIFHALACGLPIVTTRIRAAADWLVDGENGVFVPPRDSAAVVSAVTRLLNDPALRERMSENNRNLACKFDRDAVAAEFVGWYESIAKQARSAQSVRT